MTRGSATPRCYCTAYAFPHRAGGGACKRTTPQSLEEYLAECEKTVKDNLEKEKKDGK